MPDDNTPKGTVADDKPADFQSAVEAIDDILDDSDIPNTGEEVEGQEADEETDEIEGDEPEIDEDEADADDEVEQADDEDDDDSGLEASQGRFVSHDAKVRLPDGTVKTVAELAKSPLLQSDYTRKTQELAEERKSVEAAKADISGYAQQLRTERDFLLKMAEHFAPQEPDSKLIDEDFFAYQHAKASFDKQNQAIQQLRQMAMEDYQRQQHEAAQQQQERLNAEAARLVEAMPELRKPGAYEKFWRETVDVMSEYGFLPNELEQAVDHRFFRVFKDLMRYRKVRSSAPKVHDKIKGKPVLKPGKRMDAKQKTTRDKRARAERATRTGSIDDAAASLMDFDL